MVLYVLQTSYEFLNHTILAQNMEEELHLLRQQALRTLPSPSVSDSFVCLVFCMRLWLSVDTIATSY